MKEININDLNNSTVFEFCVIPFLKLFVLACGNWAYLSLFPGIPPCLFLLNLHKLGRAKKQLAQKVKN